MKIIDNNSSKDNKMIKFLQLTEDNIVTETAFIEKEILEYKQELLKGNDPDLTTGLIPVVYDDIKGSDTHWFVADTSQKWYSYTEEE